MGTFDTHGGYFAPKDYMKVEAGGSHEENPNGGVQIGVDQQGVPNLLEEGEPVYKDYVYSDNIKASERFLKENNIPEKYAGELYSKIADSFFSEAENRPNDPISRNGLEAMLGRLADAQESQKAYNEQRKLERELKQLSPDELAALEQMIATGEQMPVEQQPGQIKPEVAPEQIAPEQIAPEQVAPEQIPVMKNGGKVNKFVKAGKVNRPLSGLMNSLNYPRDWQYVPTNIGYTFYPPVDNPVQTRFSKIQNIPIQDLMIDKFDYVDPLGVIDRGSNNKVAANASVADKVEQAAKNGTLGSFPPGPASVARVGNGVRYYPVPQELQDIVDAQSERIQRNNRDDLYLPKGPGINMPVGRVEIGNPVGIITPEEDIAAQNVSENVNGSPYLSTFPRYAGAIGSGILGLYNALQKPDEYNATRYKPFVPTGRINLQNQVYNPVDQNMLMNQVLAQGNSTMRGLRNSGLGPSTQAAMIAQDNNISGNLGNTFLQAWDANNQRRNQVIAANNQAEAQRAQFDYAVDAARQRALADAQMRNAYTDLQIQQLNNAAEADKYAAVGNQINNALQALSGIGRENYAMNQVNSNTALQGYGLLGGGVGAYLPYYYMERKCGGSIERKKK